MTAAAGWVEAVTAVLAVAGASAALVGSVGLVRFETFFRRVHAPTLGTTVGTWALTLATALQTSFVERRVSLHALLIAVFVALTAPVTTMFLMRAAVFRARLASAPQGGGSAGDERTPAPRRNPDDGGL